MRIRCFIVKRDCFHSSLAVIDLGVHFILNLNVQEGQYVVHSSAQIITSWWYVFVITDELSGLLFHQREASFTCQPCRDNQDEHSSLKEELQRKLAAGLEEVLTDLLSDASTQHLLVCKMVRFTQ